MDYAVIYAVLLLLGLVGFIVSMCLVVYVVYHKTAAVPEKPLPDGQYHMHFMGYNKMTGAPIYKVDEVDKDVAVHTAGRP